MEKIFKKFQDDQYNQGVELSEYKGSYYLTRSKEGRDGKVYADWCFPQDRDKQPREKSLPWSVKLGDSSKEAFDTLALFGKALRKEMEKEDDIPY